jgi:quinol monooxygenase YgiN
MVRYADSFSLLRARALFFRDAKLGPDGGYGDRWVRVETKPIPFYFPNWPSRVAAARLHDLHHIATDYETDWPGEAEIAAWEVASGCARYHAAWILNVGAFGAGLVVAPRRLFRAFLRGRHTKTNLYKSGFDESQLNDVTVGMLRDQLGLRAPLPSASATDVGLFLLWCIPSVLAWLLFPFLTVILFWPIARFMKTQPQQRFLLLIFALFSSLIAVTLLFAQSQKSPDIANKETKSGKMEKTENEATGVNDFDFLIGSWRVHHRRLKERLARNHDWIEFDGTCVMQRILGGVGNMDENVLDFPGSAYRAVTLRIYDAAKKQWSIWWIDGRNPSHLDPPLVGGFKDGVGTFYADDTFIGKPIRVRFLWTDTMSDTPHWEQAFSVDGGKTWETNWTMDFTKAPTSARTCCPVVELRQYTLKPGKRDVLIGLFEQEFIETQEATGMTVIGTFRDMDNPDRFVWLRGFTDMPTRARALQEFYGGPVWKAHREAANATMIDSDNVLLLRPARLASGFSLENTKRPPPGTKEISHALVVATIYYLDPSAGADFVDFFERALKPPLLEAGASILAYFVTENHPNTFPALPVREDTNVFVWFSHFSDRAAYDHHAVALANSARWSKEIAEELAVRLKGSPEVLKLSPTARSQLHD